MKRETMKTIALTLAVLFLSASALKSEVTLRDIIENVRRNEALYDDLDVTLTSEYTIGGREPWVSGNMEEVAAEALHKHFVAQSGMFRIDVEGSNTTATTQPSRDRVRAFDGSTTRLYEQKAFVNIVDGVTDDEHIFRPHYVLVFPSAQETYPLSVYLSGDEAIHAHPNAGSAKDWSVEPVYLGEVEFEGLTCHRVSVTMSHVSKDGAKDAQMRMEMWLAEQRNYLPVRHLVYMFRWSREIAQESGFARDLREIEPGVWFPFLLQVESYDSMLLQRSGKQEMQWRKTWAVAEASPHPHYDVSYFRDVDYPAGTPVYEIVNGKIARSYRHGAPGPQGAELAQAGASRWRLVLAALGAIACSAGVIRWLRHPRRAPTSAEKA